LRGRSAAELRVRGAQALHARAERAGLSPQRRLPSDRAFFRLLDPARCGGEEMTAERLLAHFRARTRPGFFAAFDDATTTRAELQRRFGAARDALVARADAITQGRFDLLGRSGLDFGSPVDWQLEPTSGARAPLVHWSAIDFLDPLVCGDKKFTWELNRQQYFMTLGRAYWHTGDERYAETFAAHAAHWLDANPPKLGINWASSLEVALRAISWLWALHFFRAAPALTPALFLHLLKGLYAHARHVETYLSTYFSPNTHLTGEALGLYYVGALLPEFKRARRWRETGARVLLGQLDRHVKPDGVYLEHSTYYQRYTADFYTHFLLLARATDEPLAAADAHKLEAKLTALLDHLMYVTRPDGTTPLIGDDDGGRLAPLDDRPADDFRATLAAAACVFARGDYKHVAAAAPESLLWLLGVAGLQVYDALPAHEPAHTSRAFPDGGYYVMRDGWTPTADFMLLDGGPHGAPALNHAHAHADALGFDLAAAGRTLLVDPGTYTYTGARAWRDHFRTSPAHNTLTVDGESSSVPAGPFRWQHAADASTHAWHTHTRFDYFAATHDGYARLADPVTHERAVLFLKDDYWLIRDRVRAAGPHRYELNFQLAPGVAADAEEDDGAAALDATVDSGGVLRATVDGAPALTVCAFTDGGAWRVAEGWVSRCYGARTHAPACRYEVAAEGAQEFVTCLLPAAAAGRYEIRRAHATAAHAYELRAADGGRDLLLIRDHAAALDDSRVTANGDDSHATIVALVSDFEWTWARFDRDGALAELILIGGRACAFDGQPIIKSDALIAYAYARRDGAELIVETDAGARRVALNDSHAVVS
jgi:hypothetical protein